MILSTDPACLLHGAGTGHPEQPARYTAIQRAFEAAGLLEKAKVIGPRPVTRDDLLLVHTPRYLDLAEREILAGLDHLSTGDTGIGPNSWTAALAAAGCALAATEAVVRGQDTTAFCLVRPPGHHASPGRGMGFCILNNIALAARHAQRRLGVGRVLIVDWDVHHGNGTQDTFYSDGSVFFFSTHQWPWYPGTGRPDETGAGEGAGTTLNCPLPAGSGRREIFACFEQKLLPAMTDFRPELILLSAGFDSRLGDPLGDFQLTDQDFADLTKLLRTLADKTAHGRLVSVLEGGYSLPGLASAATAHAQSLF